MAGKPRNQNVGLWQMIRDVLVASINKGQLPVAMVGFWVLAAIMRMPPEQIGVVAIRVIDGLERRALLGYLLAAGSLMGWFFHARRQRKVIASEMDRLSGGRTARQQAALGSDIKSSEGRRA